MFYGLHAIAVVGLIGLWARSTGYDLEAAVRRRWPLAVGLGAACAGVILDPLALESAAYDPQGPISGPHARGYPVAPSPGQPTDATPWHGGIGAEGGIDANAAETGRFLRGLMQGEVLDGGWVARMKAGLFWTAPEPGACGSAFGHSGAGAGFKTDVLVSPDGRRVAVLLMNGRAGSAGDEQAHRAIWQLYCAD